MPRAIWSGAISFGLVNIPVKLYSAVNRKTVRFHQLDSSDNSRIQQKRVNQQTGEEVPYEQLVKGYEVAPDQYVVIRPEELDSIQPEKTRSIDIEDFVEMEQIDPVYYDHPYYLAPAQGAGKAYALLVAAMEEAGRVGIARVVIRSKEQLVAIRPHEGVLMMETMLFGDEVVSPSEIGDISSADASKAKRKEVEMAKQLIDSLATDFEPGRYRDSYREAVLEMVERKAQGEEIATQPRAEAPKAVPDLMAALEASIAASKRQAAGAGAGRSDGKGAGRSNGSGTGSSAGKARSGSKAKAPGKKRAPAKKRAAAKK